MLLIHLSVLYTLGVLIGEGIFNNTGCMVPLLPLHSILYIEIYNTALKGNLVICIVNQFLLDTNYVSSLA